MEVFPKRGQKMSEFDGKDHELLVDQMIRKLMKDQLQERNIDKQESDNSYVFLEKGTLNLLILYLLMKEERRTNGEVSGDGDRLFELKIVEKLNQDIVDTKQEFEETISLLKEKL